jgi:hypothetical protein
MNAIDWVSIYEKMPKTVSDNALSKLKDRFPYQVIIPKLSSSSKEINLWLLELGVDNADYVTFAHALYFKDDVIAMQCKLTWR